MPTDQQDPSYALAEVLHGAAMYNDKGYAWLGHDAKQIAAMQRGFQAQLSELAVRVGHMRLGQAIESGAAARDDSGRYAELCEHVLGVATRRR
ncbi:hypothetical protein [Xanthomonas tesorieronis]|uniref:hypothetical protein n=1 Tax=Xanthomonas tesorieronis TaxID=3160839 RepID=UPI00351136D0